MSVSFRNCLLILRRAVCAQDFAACAVKRGQTRVRQGIYRVATVCDALNFFAVNGIGAVLLSGIGDTIRVSLTGDPAQEVRAGKMLLRSLNLGASDAFEFVSCPTCGRTKIDLVSIANKVESELEALAKEGFFTKKIKVAVMGCVVNGPGESRAADIGMAGGDGCAVVFEKGEITCKLVGENIAEQFIEKVKEFYGRYKKD